MINDIKRKYKINERKIAILERAIYTESSPKKIVMLEQQLISKKEQLKRLWCEIFELTPQKLTIQQIEERLGHKIELIL